MALDPNHIEEIAFELYAAGPHGSPYALTKYGERLITDAHTMDTYRAIVRLVLEHDAAKTRTPKNPRPSRHHPCCDCVACDARRA